MTVKGYWVNKLLNQQFNKRSLESKITFIGSCASFYDEIMRSVYNLQNAKCKKQNAQFETIFSVKPSSAFGTCNLYFGIFILGLVICILVFLKVPEAFQK